MNHFHKRDAGFSLIEILVVLLLIGILSTIAFAVLQNQREKGQDSSAKANATNVVRFVESCYVQTDDYTECQTADLTNTGLPLGSGSGEVGVASNSADEFVVTSNSRSGGHFYIETTSAYQLRRTCDNASAGCRAADANGNEW